MESAAHDFAEKTLAHAKRLGAESVTMIYRRSEHEMSAYAHEYEFIKGEGVAFRFLTQPVRVLTDNSSVIGLECVRMALGEPDSTGRPARSRFRAANSWLKRTRL